MRNPTTRFVCLAAVSAAVVWLQACRHGTADQSGADTGPVPVITAKVTAQNMPVYLNGLGTVQAFNSATVRAQVSGRLVEVPLKEGQEVSAGQVLARIDPRTYQAALDQAIARQTQDQASLHLAEMDLARYVSLLPGGYVSQQQVDQQRSNVESLQAQIKADEAAIASDRVQLSYCTIVAPFDGVVGLRLVDIGNLVSPSDPGGIVTLTQTHPISVSFTLPEQTLPQFQSTKSSGLPVVAIGRENQLELARGELMAVDNQIDQATGTIKLKARFTNEASQLWPGQFINVRLLVRTASEAVTIPSASVQLGPKGAFVYVIDGANKAQMRAVKVGPSEAGQVIIDEGVAVGETVVVDGQSRLSPGAEVKQEAYKPSAAPAAGSGAAAPTGVATH